MGTDPDELTGGTPSTLPPVAANAHRRVRAQVLRNHQMTPMRMPRAKLPPPPEMQLPEMHWQDWFIAGFLAIHSMYLLFGKALTPALIGKHPVLLLFVRPTLAAMISAGALVRVGSLPLVLALIAPLPLLFIDDPFLYWAGRRYGVRMKNYLIDQDPLWETRLTRGERIMAKWNFWAIIACNIPFVPIPISVVYFLAGDTRMPIKRFVLANFIGLEIFIGGCTALGYIFQEQAQAIVDQIVKYSGWLTWGTLGLVLVVIIFSTRGSMRRVRAREEARVSKWKSENGYDDDEDPES